MEPRFEFDFKFFRTIYTLCSRENIIDTYQNKFSEIMGVNHSLAFPYGRTALLASFQILGMKKCEIIIPAYTCSVVAHAVVLSGNYIKFCDVENKTFNIDLNELDRCISQDTRAIVITNNFGQSVDQQKLQEIINKHSLKYNKKIYLIQDCAYAFDAKWNSQNIARIGDVTIFGTNISKSLTSIFGGMLSTNNTETYRKAKNWQTRELTQPNFTKYIKRLVYGLLAKWALKSYFFKLTFLIMTKTKRLDKILNSHHKDNKISFPKDAFQAITGIEAAAGIVSLNEYEHNKKKRRDIANKYMSLVAKIPNWRPINFDEGANQSHFAVAVKDKIRIMKYFSKRGVQLGEVIEYAIPYTLPYSLSRKIEYPVAENLAKIMINLPLNERAYLKIKRIIGECEANKFLEIC